MPPKINGTAKYGIDATIPGMLYGKPVVPPVRYGAKVTAVDDTAAKAVKGVAAAIPDRARAIEKAKLPAHRDLQGRPYPPDVLQLLERLKPAAPKDV